jgi:hypothetical protein
MKGLETAAQLVPEAQYAKILHLGKKSSSSKWHYKRTNFNKERAYFGALLQMTEEFLEEHATAQ